ncbi:RNA-dependent RNA polymerase [Leptomonas pyrrhocoris]|uniref:RNA-dependent RNA polymerase n=3 Tax=Leptomonas pyrrhocoris TaxID=157538 RepID=A0A0N0DYT7_LEPPY|nr:RNA-dependent RNA polymerase [Leptomonas pyrrhocoris]KPA84471.1 RNA-dependent RNA polymerase [Leptomonas pyrrhocoris]|eukprot:XP_015662910.1 RNA-dependent RNA polymerase [Leptomonas pyrrhocoris]
MIRRDLYPMKPIGFRPYYANIMDVEGNLFTRFHPDKHYWQNQLAAVSHRYGCKMPDPAKREIAEFSNFVRKRFKFFDKCHDWHSHDSWLETSNYNEARKRELYEGFIKDSIKWSHNNKSFIKDEGYDEYKMPRAINSYSDSTKYFLGPYIKSLEKKFFRNKFFVKGKSNRERDEVLRHTFGDSKVLYTDFSHFESHHRGVYAQLFVDFLYYMGGDCLEFQAARHLILGSNKSTFSSIEASCKSRLMSGALWTSFQNSFLNFFVMAYLNYKKTAVKRQFRIESLKMFIEGDDGIMKHFNYNNRIIKRLGLCLKINSAEHFSLASFCGRVISQNACFTEPTKAIDKLCWFPMRMHSMKENARRAVFKARAMSLLENNENCPILDPLARKIIQMNRNIDARVALKHFSAYERDILQDFDFSPRKLDPSDISYENRVLMEQLYGITVDQQIWFEEEILPNWEWGQVLRLTWDAPRTWIENAQETDLDNESYGFITNLTSRDQTRRLPCHIIRLFEDASADETDRSCLSR